MLWVKAFHIIFIVTWFAGIFYLPRLYVYHASSTDQISNNRFKIMERKLYYGIMMPSAFWTLILGFWLLKYNPLFLKTGWFHAKMALVALLIIYHFYCGYLRKQFRDDRNIHGHIYYRLLNEVPVLILVGAVILVVVKPF